MFLQLQYVKHSLAHQNTIKLSQRSVTHSYDQKFALAQRYGISSKYTKFIPPFKKKKQNLRLKSLSTEKRKMNSQLKNQQNFENGLQLYNKKQLHKAKNIFLYLTQNKNKYSGKASYYLANICLKKNQIQQAQRWINVAISYGITDSATFSLRAQILLICKKPMQAIKDYLVVSQLNNKDWDCLQKIGDIYTDLKKQKEAAQYYGMAAHLMPKNKIFIKRAISLSNLNMFQMALSEIDKNLKIDQNNSQLYIIKANILAKKNDKQGAMICYQRAIQADSATQVVINSLEHVLKTYLKSNMIYDAMHVLNSAKSKNRSNDEINRLQHLIYANVSMMKMNIQQGLQLLKGLQFKDLFFQQRCKQLIAYGYFSNGDLKQCQNVIKQIIQYGLQLSPSTQYNLNMIQAHNQLQSNQYSSAIALFQNASKISPQLSCPYIFKAMCIIFISVVNQKLPQKDYLITLLQKSVQHDFQNSQALLLQGIVRLSFGEYQRSIYFFNKAIQYAQQEVSLMYLAKGIALFNLHQYRHAIVELTDALQISKSFFMQALKLRTKCFTLLKEKQLAISDLTQVMRMSQNPDNQFCGDILFNLQAYQQAKKSYSSSPDIFKKKTIMLKSAACAMAARNMRQAQMQLKILYQKGDTICKNDLQCIQLLKVLINSRKQIKQIEDIRDGYFFKSQDILFYKGIQKLKNNEGKNALQLFDKAQKYLYQRQKKQSQASFTILELDWVRMIAALQIQQIQKAQIYKSNIQVLKGNQFLQDKFPFDIQGKLSQMVGQVKAADEQYMLSFDLPVMCLPQIKHEQGLQILSLVRSQQVQMKGDAPWIKRNEFGVQFTENILEVQSISSGGSTKGIKK